MNITPGIRRLRWLLIVSLVWTPEMLSAADRTGQASGAAAHAGRGGDTGTDDGYCRATVYAPAKQRNGQIEVTTRPAMTRYEIVPARLEAATQRVELRAAEEVLSVRPAVLETEPREVQVRPAERRWVRDSITGDVPLSPGEHADIEASGIVPDELAPGQCIAEFVVPAVMAERRHRVLAQESSESFEITAAQWGEATRTVTLVPGYRRLIEVPPVVRETEARVPVRFGASRASAGNDSVPPLYHDVRQPTVEMPAMVTTVIEPAQTRQVTVQRITTPARARATLLPARYETWTETYREVESRFLWHLTDPAAGSAGHAVTPTTGSSRAAGGVSPAVTDQTRTAGDEVARAILPATARPTGRIACLREWPAVVHRYRFTRVDEPATLQRRIEPAVEQRFEVRRKRSDAQAVPVELPRQAVSRRVTVELPPVPIGVQSVVCDADVDRSLVRQVQSALLQAGFDPGPIDGQSGPATRGALSDYERAMGLQVSGRFAVPTLQRLGVDSLLASSD